MRWRIDRSKIGMIVDAINESGKWVARADQEWLVLWDNGETAIICDGELERADANW